MAGGRDKKLTIQIKLWRVVMYLRISGVGKQFQSVSERVHALAGIDLSVEQGEILTLLGPSGCGKTTLLRCIAGLERPDQGRIELDGRTLFDQMRRIVVPPHDRDMAMIFQSYALWPHMTVYDNIGFPLRKGKLGLSRSETDRRVQSVLELVRLQRYGKRPVFALSGGQQQRVALARALALQPKLLLLDEPLSNLDQQLKVQTRREMHALLKSLRITSVNVTHDQGEALALSDRIAVMDQGKILQLDVPSGVFLRPADVTVARFMGHGNFLPGTLASDGGNVTARLASGEAIPIDTSHIRAGLAAGDRCLLLVPSRAITLVSDGRQGASGITAAVRRIEYNGDALDVECETEAQQVLHVRVDEALGATIDLSPGARIGLVLDPARCGAIPAPVEQALA
jgi:iron(III) transport system ATP-binding protein